MGTSRKVHRLFGDDSYLQPQNARATCTRGGKCKPNTTVSWRSWAGSTRKAKTKRRLPIPAAPTTQTALKRPSPRRTLGLAMRPRLKPMEPPQMKAQRMAKTARRHKRKKRRKKRKKRRRNERRKRRKVRTPLGMRESQRKHQNHRP